MLLGGEAGGNETEAGIVCAHWPDYNAVDYSIILQRALCKVIIGEVIFVIKLAVTLGHKSQVLVLKKIYETCLCLTIHCRPFTYFDFPTNLPLTAMGEIRTMSE